MLQGLPLFWVREAHSLQYCHTAMPDFRKFVPERHPDNYLCLETWISAPIVLPQTLHYLKLIIGGQLKRTLLSYNLSIDSEQSNNLASQLFSASCTVRKTGESMRSWIAAGHYNVLP